MMKSKLIQIDCQTPEKTEYGNLKARNSNSTVSEYSQNFANNVEFGAYKSIQEILKQSQRLLQRSGLRGYSKGSKNNFQKNDTRSLYTILYTINSKILHFQLLSIKYFSKFGSIGTAAKDFE